MTLETFIVSGIGAFLLMKPAIKQEVSTPFDDSINSISMMHLNDPALIKAIIRVESTFNPDAHNLNLPKEDSRGLGQINTADTQAMFALSIDTERLYEPDYNIECVNRFVDDIKKRYVSTQDIIAAYNRGRVEKTEDGIYVNISYVTKVYGYYTLYQVTK